MTKGTLGKSISLTNEKLDSEGDIGVSREANHRRNDGASENCSWAWTDAGKHYDWMDRHAPFCLVQDWVI
ncbi:hypothetical protein BRPE67_BCDS10690 [Caballeronia cordobensis]|nr:hypothetical protein BRPE67_BCDS10690 [Burkholderia sp. RPE67]